MSSFELRNYDPSSDFEDLRSLLQGAGLYDQDYETEEQLSRWVAIQPDSIIIATVEDDVVGSIYFQDGIIPYLFRLAVREQFRGQGIGSALLEEAEQRAKEAGHNSVELNVTEDHPELIGWYERRGYRVRASYTDMVKQL